MAKRLAKPAESVGYRLDWDKSKVKTLDLAAAEVGLSLASFFRLSLEMLVEKGKVSLDHVRTEAERL